MADVKNQHMVFAYEAIPDLFHNDPQGFLTYLRRDRLNFLRFYWDFVGKNVGEKNQVSMEGLDFIVHELDTGVTLTIITMPKPTKSKEAYFLALILPKPKGGLLLRRDVTRVFTLEYRIDDEGNPKTVLGEITHRRMHAYMGNGPDPNYDNFKKIMLEIIKTKKI